MLALAASAGLLAAPAGAAVDTASPPVWSVDPDVPGASMPPAGRSLFDYVFTAQRNGRIVYDVPFPFTRLLARLEDGGDGQVHAVLIPLGRSLQRAAAAPHYFDSPRVVAAVTPLSAASAERPGGPWQDRLFLGYQARAGIVEVISYNDAAGRFEFQVVQDYRAGATPRVAYVDRSLCMRCHQNAGPIFSRPLWDETNANADVAERLAAHAERFHGVPARVGVDIPDAIDAATDRASRLAVYQRIWQEGCGALGEAPAVRCRAILLVEVLRFRLAGDRHQLEGRHRRAAAAALDALWREAWPGGLAIANPDIPNRRLTLFAAGPGPLDLPASLVGGTPIAAAEAADFDAALEPFVPRAPADVWHPSELDTGRLDDVVAGLASFLSAGDIAEIDRLLRARRTPGHVVRSACSLGTDRAPPAGALRYTAACRTGARGREGDLEALLSVTPPRADAYLGALTVRRLSIGGEPPMRHRGMPLARAGKSGLVSQPGGAQLRTLGGDAITRLTLRPDPGAATATLEVELARDFELIVQVTTELGRRTLAGSDDVLATAPLRRQPVVSGLIELLGGRAGDPRPADGDMPPAVLESSMPGDPGNQFANP